MFKHYVRRPPVEVPMYVDTLRLHFVRHSMPHAAVDILTQVVHMCFQLVIRHFAMSLRHRGWAGMSCIQDTKLV